MYRHDRRHQKLLFEFLSLLYFAFRNGYDGDDDDDDRENDENQREKIRDNDEYESDNI